MLCLSNVKVSYSDGVTINVSHLTFWTGKQGSVGPRTKWPMGLGGNLKGRAEGDGSGGPRLGGFRLYHTQWRRDLSPR